MRGKAVEAESPSGNGIVLTSAETGQVRERGRGAGVGCSSKFNNLAEIFHCLVWCGVGTPWYWEILLY